MRKPGLKLGRLRGIDIAVDPGVLPLLAVLSLLLATSVLPHSTPGHIALTYWSVALVVAVLFLASLLVHELAHSLVAERLGIGVRNITLWMLGGVSELESEPATPGAAFLVALVGPLASIGFGAGALALAQGLHSLGGPAIYVTALQWLGIVNVFLGALNLLPGVPLDGGHLLAAVVWKLRGSNLKGYIAATVAGRLIALVIAGLGLYELTSRGSWFGIWNIGIGLILYQSARYREQFLRLEESLGDAVVEDVMDSAPQAASSLATIAQAVDAAERSGHQSAVPIVNWSGRVVALVELSDLYRVPRSRWDQTTALAAAPEDGDFVVAAPGERVADVLTRMGEQHRRHAAVLSEGTLIGLVGPEQLARSGTRQEG